jgi:hypothetical protein
MGTTLLLTIAVAMLLGLRHATDPDHLTAVTTLIAGRERAVRSAARLGLAWGIGHATTLIAFGLPIILYRAFLPEVVQRAAETAVGIVIVGLAIALLHRHRTPHGHRSRTPLQAYGIGVVHGTGGSAGVGVLLLASNPSHTLAAACLVVFALCTALSMAVLSSGFGLTLARPAVQRGFARLAPAFALASLAFGIWYALGAQHVVPY